MNTRVLIRQAGTGKRVSVEPHNVKLGDQILDPKTSAPLRDHKDRTPRNDV